MKLRFPIFVLLLLVSAGLLGYGVFLHEAPVFKKPDPRDNGAIEKQAPVRLGEFALTDWIASERIQRQELGGKVYLIDLEQQAECFS
ncbi:MAG: hypothetical protein MUE73_05095 [Planctomycetes bacterium]|jgi:hypothetical protein|nr:hypothetical protein [Planctomycetota bacterium]